MIYINSVCFCFVLTILITAVKGLGFPDTSFSIQRGWYSPGNGYQYTLSSRKLTYYQANRECKGWGGNLALNGMRDRFFFEKIARNFSAPFWIGLSDRKREQRFRWADKRPVNQGWMSDWHFMHPDDQTNEDCVVLADEPCTASSKILDDVSCNLKHFALCERTVGSPPHYHAVSIDGTIYALITSEASYNIARNQCRDWGGKLAERPVVNATLARDLSIELYNRSLSFNQLDSWVGVNDINEETSLLFDSGAVLNTSSINWETTDNNRLSADCATLNPRSFGKITMEECNEMKTILCEKDSVSDGQDRPTECLPKLSECELNGFRTIDGSCHNLLNPDRGRQRRAFKRMLPAAYEDGVGVPRGGIPSRLPSARAITQGLKGANEPESTLISHQFPLWGQFFAHDLTKLGELKDENGIILLPCPCGDSNPNCFNIQIPTNDEVRTQMECYSFVRAEQVPDINCETYVRQQENRVTSYIDASNVYGSTQLYISNLRTVDGLLKTGNYTTSQFYDNLPLGTQVPTRMHSEFECEPIHFDFTHQPCFAAGDIRVNEQAALSSGHTAWLRKHNQIAQELNLLNPHWDSDRTFQTARSIIAALHQQITFKEFFPILLGSKNMKRFGLTLTKRGYYYGYDASYDSTIDISFATAALRLGHTLINGMLSRPHPDFSPNPAETIDLRSQFFDTRPLFEQFGTGSVLRGMVSDFAMAYDTQFAEALTNHLFAKAGEFGKDLPAINIQRGRDHGIPSYLEHRRFCGLSTSRSFGGLEDIPLENRRKLRQLYRSPEDIDLFAGGISEVPRYSDSGVPGPTFACLIAYQGRGLRRGDSFWYENGGAEAKFTYSQLEAIKRVSLARVICDVGENVSSIQPQAMLQDSVPDNAKVPCSSLPHLDLSSFLETSSGFVNSLPNEGNSAEDNEWTEWFPLSFLSGRKIPLHPGPALLRHLRVYRTDDVCDDVIGTETRQINGYYQVRYKCRPGAIKATDFPPVDSAEVYWTNWSDQSKPKAPYFDDDENISGSGACLYPVAIQAQTINNVPARETGDVFEMLSPWQGLLCKGVHQLSGRCHDYRIRFLCLNAQ